jgi:hypothetical protein
MFTGTNLRILLTVINERIAALSPTEIRYRISLLTVQVAAHLSATFTRIS